MSRVQVLVLVHLVSTLYNQTPGMGLLTKPLHFPCNFGDIYVKIVLDQ